jgi:hypothetical protein
MRYYYTLCAMKMLCEDTYLASMRENATPPSACLWHVDCHCSQQDTSR